jgi:hypothetical protein
MTQKQSQDPKTRFITKVLPTILQLEGGDTVKESTGDISKWGIRQNVYDSYTDQRKLPGRVWKI